MSRFAAQDSPAEIDPIAVGWVGGVSIAHRVATASVKSSAGITPSAISRPLQLSVLEGDDQAASLGSLYRAPTIVRYQECSNWGRTMPEPLAEEILHKAFELVEGHTEFLREQLAVASYAAETIGAYRPSPTKPGESELDRLQQRRTMFSDALQARMADGFRALRGDRTHDTVEQIKAAVAQFERMIADLDVQIAAATRAHSNHNYSLPQAAASEAAIQSRSTQAANLVHYYRDQLKRSADLLGRLEEIRDALPSGSVLAPNSRNTILHLIHGLARRGLPSVSDAINPHLTRIQPTHANLERVINRSLQELERATANERGHFAIMRHPSMARTCIASAPLRAELRAALSAADWPTFSRTLVDPQSFSLPASYAAYWSAFRAAQGLTRTDLETRVAEDIHTANLLSEMRSQLQGYGRKTMYALGYINPVLDFYLFNASSKGIETNLGGDFALVVVADFGEGASCYRVVVQMKNADDDVASIYRENARQFKNLGLHGDAAFYGFIQLQDWQGESRGAQPAYSFRPYRSVEKEMRTRAANASVAVETLPQSSWDVDTFEDAIDFPTLVGSALFGVSSGLGCSAENMFAAIDQMCGEAEDAQRLVEIVAIFAIGKPLDPVFIRRLQALHFDLMPSGGNPATIRRKTSGRESSRQSPKLK